MIRAGGLENMTAAQPSFAAMTQPAAANICARRVESGPTQRLGVAVVCQSQPAGATMEVMRKMITGLRRVRKRVFLMAKLIRH